MGENPTSQQQEDDCRFGRLNERGVPDNEFEYFCLTRKGSIVDCPGHERDCPIAQRLLKYEEDVHNLDEDLVGISEVTSELEKYYSSLCGRIAT
jgi:hypothetical protein